MSSSAIYARQLSAYSIDSGLIYVVNELSASFKLVSVINTDLLSFFRIFQDLVLVEMVVSISPLELVHFLLLFLLQPLILMMAGHSHVSIYQDV